MVWLQVIFFIITNVPTLIRAIRELMDVFRNDKKVAKAVLNDLREAKKYSPQSTSAQLEAFERVIAKYQKKVKRA